MSNNYNRIEALLSTNLRYQFGEPSLRQYLSKETKIIKEILKSDGSDVPAPSFLVYNLKTGVHTAYVKTKVRKGNNLHNLTHALLRLKIVLERTEISPVSKK